MRQKPHQKDVAAAIAAARVELKPAVDAGMFSSNRSTRLKRFHLKHAITRLDNYRGPSWDETAFDYDDKRAQPVIAEATAGGVEADAILREIARGRLQQGLPPNLAGYIAIVLANQGKRDRRGRPRNFDRDVCIYFAVESLRQRGFNPTRNDEPKQQLESGSSIVVSALKELGVNVPEKTIAGIWQRVHRSVPANSVRI